MINVNREGFVRCNFCEDPGLVPHMDIDEHMLQDHKNKLLYCLLCKSLGNQETGFENFVNISKHVVEELNLDSTDRREICKKILCPGNPDHLKVFRCLLCPYEGMKFVGLPEEVFLAHVAKTHGEEAAKENPLELVWECRVCRGLLMDDRDLTRHILKRHIRRGIFNSFPFAAFVYSTPEAASKTPKNNGINKDSKSASVDMMSLLENMKTGTGISESENEANTKNEDRDEKIKSFSNNVAGILKLDNDDVTGPSESKTDSENEDITDISYSEHDEKRYLRMGSVESDIWDDISENNHDNKENENKQFFNNNSIDAIFNKSTMNNLKELQACCEVVPTVKCDLCDEEEILNLHQHLTERHPDASFLCIHCSDPFIEIDPAREHVEEYHGKDSSGLDLLKKGHIKPPSFLVTVLCRMCQPTQRLMAASSKDLHFKVLNHMEGHRALWSSGEEMVGYGCRICVDRSWDEHTAVLDHIERRHKRHGTEKKRRTLNKVDKHESRSKYARTELPPTEKDNLNFFSASKKYFWGNEEQSRSKEYSHVKRSLLKDTLPCTDKSGSRKYKESSCAKASPKTSSSSKYKSQNNVTESEHDKRREPKYTIPYPNSSSSRKSRESRNVSRHQGDEKLHSQYIITFSNSNRSRKYKDVRNSLPISSSSRNYKEKKNAIRSRHDHDKFIPFPNSSSSRKYKEDKNITARSSEKATRFQQDIRMLNPNHSSSQNKVKRNTSKHGKEEPVKVQDYMEERRQMIENLMSTHSTI